MPIAFSGMTGNRDLFITDVVHKAFVSVDEAGTEVAAATAVIMELTAAPEESVEVTVDRPFERKPILFSRNHSSLFCYRIAQNDETFNSYEENR